MKELVSVIVPVYNVEKYLDRCIRSILEQTYNNLEIILIDDGSKDSSGEICERYQKQDARIVVVHQENAGQAAARNKGLDIAKGEWICFVDSDDFVKEDFVEYLYTMAYKNDFDIAFCGICHIDFPNRKEEGNEEIIEKKYSGKEAAKNILEGRNGFNASACRGIYRAGLFENVRFIPGRLYEDLEILIKLSLNSEGCVQGSKKNYCYCYRSDNSSTTPVRKKTEDFVAVMDSIYELVRKEENEWLLDSAYARDMMNCLFIISGKNEQNRNCRDEVEFLRKRILAMPKGYELQSPLYKMYYQALRLGLIPFDIACDVLGVVRKILINLGL